VEKFRPDDGREAYRKEELVRKIVKKKPLVESGLTPKQKGGKKGRKRREKPLGTLRKRLEGKGKKETKSKRDRDGGGGKGLKRGAL